MRLGQYPADPKPKVRDKGCPGTLQPEFRICLGSTEEFYHNGSKADIAEGKLHRLLRFRFSSIKHADEFQNHCGSISVFGYKKGEAESLKNPSSKMILLSMILPKLRRPFFREVSVIFTESSHNRCKTFYLW